MNRAFNLIELPGVVAVIAILAALLMPARNKARNHAAAAANLNGEAQPGQLAPFGAGPATRAGSAAACFFRTI